MHPGTGYGSGRTRAVVERFSIRIGYRELHAVGKTLLQRSLKRMIDGRSGIRPKVSNFRKLRKRTQQLAGRRGRRGEWTCLDDTEEWIGNALQQLVAQRHRRRG